MTKEEIAKWIGRAFIVFTVAVIIAIVFAPERGKPAAAQKDQADTKHLRQHQDGQDRPSIIQLDRPGSLREGQIAETFAAASKKHGSLVVGILHCHVPGNPESEQIADILNRVARKYGAQVQVVRADIIACPELVKIEKVTKPPKVVMMVDNLRACKFQGLWTQAQIERKVDELLYGIKRVGKNWLPEVKGMQPASRATPALPIPSARQ